MSYEPGHFVFGNLWGVVDGVWLVCNNDAASLKIFSIGFADIFLDLDSSVVFVN